ncbi:MAG: ribonuclease HII [Cenarchaeum symbiont of Oopsacas minuta]|nr:ribonuclease HII [Cenarchaeum symbiont of Oopsacas minuta]
MHDDLISWFIFILSVRVCGVDEAGRGPIFGPLVVAGVAIERSKLGKLRRLGLKDSKKLCPNKRVELYSRIIKIVDAYTISRIQPRTIDKNVSKHNLNKLEAKFMGRIIDRLDADVAYVDACDTNATRFGKEIAKMTNDAIVHSYHKADERFAIVSAASILAKVARDRAITKLGINCSGYPSDPKTRKYLVRYIKKHSKAPACARQSWKPVKIALKI